MNEYLGAFFYFVLVTFLAIGWGLIAAYGQPALHPNCTEFGVNIPTSCCCTNNCCTEAPPTEFENLGNDNYRSNVTGQILRRTGWSAGGFIKCACDLQDNGTWKKHPGAKVRCLFVPMPSA